ncbi:hypothetical protein FGB62_33g182 [Gracilaria domingensis]|nr:hypothetical protein FGB62_33g182 [Gracilaria domingensis]
MAVELPPFSPVPVRDVPDAPSFIALPQVSAQSSSRQSDLSASPSSAHSAEHDFPDEEHFRLYPRLRPHLYHNRRSSSPENVLVLVHNAAKREIADLLLVILPAIEHHATLTDFSCRIKDAPVFGERLYQWWSTLLRVFFFVAETDEDVVNLVIKPVARYARKSDDHQLSNSLQLRHKSVLDRYSFTMEVVLRAADRALDDFECVPDVPKLNKLIEKLTALSNFMLETMDTSLQLVQDAANVCEVQISSLEYTVANSMFAFANTDPNVFVYIFARWMHKESDVKQWLAKYAGLRARLFFESWKRAYNDKRASIVQQIAALHKSSSE